MARQEFRLAFRHLWKRVFNNFSDALVQRAAGLTQQRAMGRVPHQGMLEQVARMRRHALSEQQTGGHQTV